MVASDWLQLPITCSYQWFNTVMQKEVYMDGHIRKDVVDYRNNIFLSTIKGFEKQMSNLRDRKWRKLIQSRRWSMQDYCTIVFMQTIMLEIYGELIINHMQNLIIEL